MSAISLLTKAIEYDVSGRRIEALKLYEDGITELLKMCKAETNPEKKKHFQTKILEYMKRAEQVKAQVTEWHTKGEIRDKIHVIEGAVGFSYRRIFDKYLTDDVKEILIEEPYLKEHYQICNLVMFCELAVLKCRNLKYIRVTTVKETRPNTMEQERGFKCLAESLEKRHINIGFDFSETMHDRQVILSNGYIVKIGRGLHFFKPPPNKYSLGAFDHDLRECRETNIDILFCPENKK